MLLGTLKGILVAIVISLVSLAQQVADPPVYRLGRKRGTSVFRPLSAENPDDETFPGLLMLRPVGRLFFVNGQRVAEKMRLLDRRDSAAGRRAGPERRVRRGVHRPQDAGGGRGSA